MHHIEGMHDWDPDQEKKENEEAQRIPLPHELRQARVEEDRKRRATKIAARNRDRQRNANPEEVRKQLNSPTWVEGKDASGRKTWTHIKEGAYIKEYPSHVGRDEEGEREIVYNREHREKKLPEEIDPGTGFPGIPPHPGGYKVKDLYEGPFSLKPEHRGKQKILGPWYHPGGGGPDEPGWQRDHKNIGGWHRTLQFEREQAKRSKEARKQGVNHRGYRLFDDYGTNPKRAPEQKADVGLGSNWEYRMETYKWELMHPDRDKNKQTKLEFSLSNEPPHGEVEGTVDPIAGVDDEGKIYEESKVERKEPTLTSVLSDAGARGAFIERTPEQGNPWKYKITLPEGRNLNPDEAAKVQAYVDSHFHLRRKENEEGTPIPEFEYSGPAMKPKIYRVPLGASKSPVPDDQIYSSFKSQKYTKPLNAKISVRDEQGNLKPGDADVLAVKVSGKKINVGDHEIGFGDRVAYWNLQERSDAVGWGTGWRPGEQEINKALTAIPRQRDYERLGEALDANEHGDSTKLDEYIHDKYPDAHEQQMDRLREEMKVAGAAVGAAAFYSAKKHGKKSIVTRGVNRTWHAARKLPPVRKLDEKVVISNRENHDLLNFTGDRPDPFTTKYFRAKSRIRHPIRDIDNPHISGVHWNMAPEMKSIRYRERGVWGGEGEVRARKIEKESRKIQKVVGTQKDLKSKIKSHPTTKRGHLDRKIALKTASRVEHDPDYQNYLSTDTLNARQAEWERLLADKKEHVRVREEAARGLKGLRDVNPNELRLSEGETKVLRSVQHKGWTPIEKTNLLNGKAGKIGKTGLVGAAALGAGIYLYDRHRHNQLETRPQSETLAHRVVPESIKTPSFQVKRTKTKVIPRTDLTEGLELTGMKYPAGFKASLQMKEHRIKGRKDISGDVYKPGPLVGGVKLKPPTPVEGSRKEAIIGPQKGRPITVKGQKTGLYYSEGKKDRWNDGRKSRKLKSANPARLDQGEKEDIAYLIQKSGDPQEREKLTHFYSGDQTIQDYLTDQEEMDRISHQHKNFYMTREGTRARERMSRVGDREMEKSAAVFGKTLQQSRREQEQDRIIRRDKEDRERAGYAPGMENYHPTGFWNGY